MGQKLTAGVRKGFMERYLLKQALKSMQDFERQRRLSGRTRKKGITSRGKTCLRNRLKTLGLFTEEPEITCNLPITRILSCSFYSNSTYKTQGSICLYSIVQALNINYLNELLNAGNLVWLCIGQMQKIVVEKVVQDLIIDITLNTTV